MKIALQSILIAVTLFNFIFGQEYHIALQVPNKKGGSYASEIELLFNSSGILEKVEAGVCYIGRGEKGRPDEPIFLKPGKSLFKISEEIKGNIADISGLLIPIIEVANENHYKLYKLSKDCKIENKNKKQVNGQVMFDFSSNIVVITKIEVIERTIDAMCGFIREGCSGDDPSTTGRIITISNDLPKNTFVDIYATRPNDKTTYSIFPDLTNPQTISEYSTIDITISDEDFYQLWYKFKYDGITSEPFKVPDNNKFALTQEMVADIFDEYPLPVPEDLVGVEINYEYIFNNQDVQRANDPEDSEIPLPKKTEEIRHLIINDKVTTIENGQLKIHPKTSLIIVDMNSTYGPHRKNQSLFKNKIKELFEESSNRNVLVYKYFSIYPIGIESFTAYKIRDGIYTDWMGNEYTIDENSLASFQNKNQNNTPEDIEKLEHFWVFEPIRSLKELEKIEITPNAKEDLSDNTYLNLLHKIWTLKEVINKYTIENIHYIGYNPAVDPPSKFNEQSIEYHSVRNNFDVSDLISN